MKRGGIGKGCGEAGVTLVELVVVMLIFGIIMALTSQAFQHVIATSSQEGEKAESNIQGVLGLELMRSDIEQAGYGLPWLLSGPATFPEMDSGKVPSGSLAAGIDSTSFNDSAEPSTVPDPNKVPRALQSGTGSTGIGYLVVKSTVAGFDSTAAKWAYDQYSGAGGADTYIQKWNTSDDFVPNELVVTLDSATRQLITSGGSFSYLTAGNGANPMLVPAGFTPTQSTDVYLTYGVAAQSASVTALRAPYNRADFFVGTPSGGMPQRCAPGTGVLYKGVLNHSDGGVTKYPLQVRLGVGRVPAVAGTGGGKIAGKRVVDNPEWSPFYGTHTLGREWLKCTRE